MALLVCFVVNFLLCSATQLSVCCCWTEKKMSFFNHSLQSKKKNFDQFFCCEKKWLKIFWIAHKIYEKKYFSMARRMKKKRKNRRNFLTAHKRNVIDDFAMRWDFFFFTSFLCDVIAELNPLTMERCLPLYDSINEDVLCAVSQKNTFR